MKIILCAVKTDLEIEKTCPSMGILSLAPIAEAMGHYVRVVTPVEYPYFINNIEYELKDCEIVGVSATSYNWYITRELISLINSVNPTIRIILGGVHPTIYPDYCLQSTAAYAVVRHEGELTFPLLVDAISNNKELAGIDGITFKTHNNKIISNKNRPMMSEESLNGAPLPAYHLVPPNMYGYLPFENSRGCYYNCSFCGILFHSSHRCISEERAGLLIKKLQGLPDRFAQRGIFFTDDSFGANKRNAHSILDKLSHTDFILGLEARCDDIKSHNMFPYFEKNRFYLIQIGVESGYQAGVNKVNKKISLSSLYEFAELCNGKAFSKAVSYSMTIGYPWEGEEHILLGINLAYELAAISGANHPLVNNFNPLPGSQMLRIPDKFGMPAIGPEFFDDGNWFRPYLGFTPIPHHNKDILAQYLQWRRMIYPAIPNDARINFPDGKQVISKTFNVAR